MSSPAMIQGRMFDRFSDFLSIAAGIPLLVSGWLHWMNPFAFYESIRAYKLLSDVAAALVAFGLPGVLICCAGSLIFGHWRHAGQVVGSILFACFAFLQLSALIRGLNISCGCFGDQSKVSIFYATLWAVTSVMLATLGVYSAKRV